MLRCEAKSYMDNFEETPEKFNYQEAMNLAEKTIASHSPEILPEVQLVIAIIKSAAKDRDLEFFYGIPFKKYCKFLGLDSTEIKNTIINKELLSGKKFENKNLTK